MNKENKEKMCLLNIEHYKLAKRFYRDLRSAAKDKKERENVFSDFLSLLYDGQMKEQKISEAIPDYKEFFAETIKNVKKRNRPCALFHKSIRPASITALIVSGVLLVGITIAALLQPDDGYYNPLSLGGYVTSQEYTYTKSSVQIKPCELDLRFLDLNRNKIIFYDGVCKISINAVNFTRITDTDGNLTDCFYDVVLISEGKYKNDYARVVCGKMDTLPESYYTPPISGIPISKVSYQIGGQTFIQESHSREAQFRTVYLCFTISAGENGKDAQELYAMDKITLEFDNFFINEWFL